MKGFQALTIDQEALVFGLSCQQTRPGIIPFRESEGHPWGIRYTPLFFCKFLFPRFAFSFFPLITRVGEG